MDQLTASIQYACNSIVAPLFEITTNADYLDDVHPYLKVIFECQIKQVGFYSLVLDLAEEKDE